MGNYFSMHNVSFIYIDLYNWLKQLNITSSRSWIYQALMAKTYEVEIYFVKFSQVSKIKMSILNNFNENW